MRARTSAVGVALAACAVLGIAATTAGAAPLQHRGAAVATHSAPSLKKLKVSIRFTRKSYKPGATAHIVLTLRNAGSTRLHGIHAACDRAGDPNELLNKGKSWGGLGLAAKGVSPAAHSTHTYKITAKVPVAAQRAGSVVLACDFGYRNVDSGYRPVARATAEVPGQSGAIDAYVRYYQHGTSGPMSGLQGVRAVLLDRTTCPLVKRTATTDATGHFRIARAPAGSSDKLYLFTPAGWKVLYPNPTNARVFGKDTAHFSFEVQRGTSHNPTPPTTCS